MNPLITLLVGFPLGAYRTFVVFKGWQWFILPIFGIAVPPFLMLWGLMTLTTLIMPGNLADSSALTVFAGDSPVIAVTAAYSLVSSSFCLLFMYIMQALS